GSDLGMFVRAIVVQNQMELQLFWKLLIQSAQEPQELLVAMSREALANDLALENFQRRKQRRSPVAHVIMSESAATAFVEWQTRLSAVQGLNLALLINA